MVSAQSGLSECENFVLNLICKEGGQQKIHAIMHFIIKGYLVIQWIKYIRKCNIWRSDVHFAKNLIFKVCDKMKNIVIFCLNIFWAKTSLIVFLTRVFISRILNIS